MNALLLSTCLALAFGQQHGRVFDTTLKSVAVFRDGYGYYVREGKVKLENGWGVTNFVPTAIKGTVWVYSTDKGDRIDTVITTKDDKIDFTDTKDLKSKLTDKIGLKLIVILKNGQRFEGELARLLDDMLLLKADAGFSAIPYEQVKTVSFEGYPIKVKVDTKEPNKTTTLGFAYLQEGIRWDPSYVLNVGAGKATLELRASMQNTTESLSKSDVEFVVGSPFVVNRGIQDMVGLIPPTAVAAPVTADKAAPTPSTPVANAPNLAPTVAGEESGELFFYKKSDLSIDSNDIAMVSIFQSSVPISPQFEWNADGEEVDYILGFKNTTKQPLTTGPVFVLEDGKAIGQETIKYTPEGESAEIKLSRGVGISVDKTEAEVKRSAPVHIGKSDFINVTLKGTLKITNFRSSSANIKVTKTARGRVTSQSDNGIVTQTQVLSGEVNPINDMQWKISIPAGATKVLTYTVDTYVFADRAGTPPVPATAGEGGGRR